MSIEFVYYIARVYKINKTFLKSNIIKEYNQLRSKPDDYKIDEYESRLIKVDTIVFDKVISDILFYMKRGKK